MSDIDHAAEVRALIAEARRYRRTVSRERSLLHRLADALEAAHAEPDNDEREALMRVLNQPEHAPMSDHDPRDGSCRSCPWPVYTLAPEDIAHAVLAAGFRRAPRVPVSRAELALAQIAADGDWAPREPVSRDELAENLRRIHFDGTGCGTTASTACSNCFGPSPMTAREVAEHLSATYDIYPKADRKLADSQTGDD